MNLLEFLPLFFLIFKLFAFLIRRAQFLVLREGGSGGAEIVEIVETLEIGGGRLGKREMVMVAEFLFFKAWPVSIEVIGRFDD